MTQKEVIDFITNVAKTVDLDPDLALAIAGHETNFDPNKTRYEVAWKYLVQPYVYAEALGITPETEKVLQSMSWGPMQVMGSVARELGFRDQLPLLVKPELGILFGCRKLKAISKLYPKIEDSISAFNQGSPVKENGIYKNQVYVDDVMERLKRLRTI